MISEFKIFRRFVTVRTKADGQYVNGFWEPGIIENEYSLLASVQPTPAKELEMAPEGRYTADQYTLFSDTRLKNITDGENPDVVKIGERWYEVVKSAKWNNDIVNNWRSVVAKPINSLDVGN